MEWRGDVPRRHWLSLPLWCPAGWFSPCGTGSPCRCGVRRGAESQRHWLALPRGRGPSQTPPSRATDSSISPGPPSPWLPALLIGNRFLSFLRQPRVQSRGCKGRSPLHEITLVSPFPPGRGAGGWGRNRKLKAGAGGRPKPPRPPTRQHGGRANKCRAGARPPPGA